MTMQQQYRSIEEIEERLDEIRADVQNLDAEFAGRKFDDEARERWNAINDEKGKLESLRTELVKRRERLAELAGNPAAHERGHDSGDHPGNLVTGQRPSSWSARDGVPALWPTRDEMRRLHRAALTGTNVRIESRSTVTASDTGADDLARQLSVRGRRERRIAVQAGLSADTVGMAEQVRFPVFGEGDADVTDEGDPKTEYDGVTEGSTVPKVIAIWTDTTRQNLLTMTNFEAKLRSVLAAKVARREDLLLTTSVLATSGIQTLDMDSGADPDAVLEAASMVAAGDVAAEPNLFLFNPEDTADLFGADAFNANQVTDARQLDFRLHGMVGYPTNAISQGEVVVGAWPEASRLVVGLRPTFLVDAFSGIKTNTVTILLEEAVNIAVDEPAGFCYLRPETT